MARWATWIQMLWSRRWATSGEGCTSWRKHLMASLLPRRLPPRYAILLACNTSGPSLRNRIQTTWIVFKKKRFSSLLFCFYSESEMDTFEIVVRCFLMGGRKALTRAPTERSQSLVLEGVQWNPGWKTTLMCVRFSLKTPFLTVNLCITYLPHERPLFLIFL